MSIYFVSCFKACVLLALDLCARNALGSELIKLHEHRGSVSYPWKGGRAVAVHCSLGMGQSYFYRSYVSLFILKGGPHSTNRQIIDLSEINLRVFGKLQHASSS